MDGVERISVPLTEDERAALRRASERERRSWGAQAAVLVRQGLERAGYLPVSDDKAESAAAGEASRGE